MKKKIFFSIATIFTCLLIPFSLKAATNRIEIVHNNHLLETKQDNGYNFLNTINTEKSDLVNGNLEIEITLDNSKQTEIFYVVDNGKKMSEIKNEFIDILKTNAKVLEGMYNVKQGVITTTDGTTSFKDLDNQNIEMQLESIKSIDSSNNDGELLASIDKAAASFSEGGRKTNRKFIVIALASLPNDTTSLKAKIDEYNKNGIQFFVYGAKQENDTAINQIFEKAIDKKTNNNMFSSIDIVSAVKNDLPNSRNMEIALTFDSFITNNFDIKNIKTDQGRIVNYDADKKEIDWKIGQIGTNEITKLTYTLSLKSAVDESVVEKMTMRTNRQVIFKENTTHITKLPNDDEIDNENKRCSPTIRILREAIDNPKTGLTDYLVFGLCLISVASVTLLILNSKKQFNRI